MVTLQSDVDMVQDEIRAYQEFVEILRTLPGHAERQAYCLQRMAERSRCITATVSYAGKANFGEVEHYIQEFEALPSTALPSTHVPLTIEMSALLGYFFINFNISMNMTISQRSWINSVKMILTMMSLM